MQEQYNHCTLSCGMPLLHIMSPTQVAYCGMAIDAGTRDEKRGEYGIAHLCEHMLFKGTTHRRSHHIINRMERVGGDLNAYTTKEETMVYAAFMRQHLARAAELIADIVFNSTYPQRELEKEVEVVVEEIESYNDNPAELIYDDFENIVFHGHPLGHNILGKPNQIRRYTSDHLHNFTSRLYHPRNIVFFVYGNYDFDWVRKTVEKAIGNLPQPLQSREERTRMDGLFTPPLEGQGTVLRHRSTHQTHVLVGCPAYPPGDRRRVALYLLNNIIGGPGMNSLLNIALREKNGLVYTVESTLTNYTDTALFAIYFGCDHDQTSRCLDIVRQQLDQLIDRPLTPRQFNAAMQQIEGQIGVSSDNFENYALDMAKCYLHYNRYEGINETLRQLASLTPADLQQVASELFPPERLTTLVYTH